MNKKKIVNILGVSLIFIWLLFIALGIFVKEIFFIPVFFLGLFVLVILFGFIESLLPFEKMKYLPNILFGFLPLIVGCGILLLQVIGFLKNGSWEEFSIVSLLSVFRVDWAANPSDWLGLWKILNAIPVSFTMIIISSFVLSADPISKRDKIKND